MSQDIGQNEKIEQLVQECLAKSLQPILNRLEQLESKYDEIRNETTQKFSDICTVHLKIKQEIQQFQKLYLSLEEAQELAKQILSKTDIRLNATQKLPDLQDQVTKSCSQFNTESNLSLAKPHQLTQSLQTQQINKFIVSGDEIVYRTKTKAKKFHKKNCGTLANTKEIIAVQRDKAILDGLDGCGICKV